MNITIQVSQKLAPVLCSSARAQTRVAALVESVGAVLTPLHPGANDAVLRTYFTLEAPDASVDELLERLRATDGVIAAYVKPAESPAG